MNNNFIKIFIIYYFGNLLYNIYFIIKIKNENKFLIKLINILKYCDNKINNFNNN